MEVALDAVAQHLDCAHGLATWTPDDPAAYAEMGRRMAEQGYAGRFRQAIGAE
jgi:hypothetical protein